MKKTKIYQIRSKLKKLGQNSGQVYFENQNPKKEYKDIITCQFYKTQKGDIIFYLHISNKFSGNIDEIDPSIINLGFSKTGPNDYSKKVSLDSKEDIEIVISDIETIYDEIFQVDESHSIRISSAIVEIDNSIKNQYQGEDENKSDSEESVSSDPGFILCNNCKTNIPLSGKTINLSFTYCPKCGKELKETTNDNYNPTEVNTKVNDKASNNFYDVASYLAIGAIIILIGLAIADIVIKRKHTKTNEHIEVVLEDNDSIRQARFIRDSIAAIQRKEQRERQRINDSIRNVRLEAERERLRKDELARKERERIRIEKEKKELAGFVNTIEEHYNYLLRVKNTNYFRQYGFMVGTDHNFWLKNIETLRNNPKATILYERYGFSVYQLQQLGQEYIESGGRETDFSRTIRIRIERLLKEFK